MQAVTICGENPLPRIHQAASVVSRSIGGCGRRQSSPQPVGIFSVVCEYLHRMWFLHSERKGCTKNLLNLGLEWIRPMTE